VHGVAKSALKVSGVIASAVLTRGDASLRPEIKALYNNDFVILALAERGVDAT